MSNYTGQKCPVCHQAFTETDDIVVCPDCGTPYHRSCWEEKGVCLFAGQHGTGYEWKPEGQAQSAACPSCGAQNPEGARFCNSCGSPMSAQQPPKVKYAAPNSFGAGEQNDRARFEEMEREGYVRRMRPDDEIEGIKARDWAAYLGSSTPFYLMNFARMAQTGRRLAVSFSAFLFGPIYFFYRKAWKPAFFFAALSLILIIPSVIALLYVAGGLPVWMQNVALINAMSMTASYLGWGLRVVRGLFGIYIYKQYALPKVKEICAAIPEGPERQAALARIGGSDIRPVILYVLFWVLLYFLLVFFITNVLGPEALERIVAYAEAMMNYMS